MHPALSLAPFYIYVYFRIIQITCFQLKFFTRFSSNPFELLGLPILSWFIHHINARHEIQDLNFLIFLPFLFSGLYIQIFTEHFVLRHTLGQRPPVRKLHFLTTRRRLVMWHKLHFICLPSFHRLGELSETLKSTLKSNIWSGIAKWVNWSDHRASVPDRLGLLSSPLLWTDLFCSLRHLLSSGQQ